MKDRKRKKNSDQILKGERDGGDREEERKERKEGKEEKNGQRKQNT